MPARAVDASVVSALVAGCAIAALTYAWTSNPDGHWEDLPPLGQPWSLGQFFGADWDEAVVGCPYDAPEQLTATLGSAWSRPDLSMRDDVQVVVLLKAGEVVAQDTVAPRLVDLCSDGLRGLTPATKLVQERVDGALRTRVVTSGALLG